MTTRGKVLNLLLLLALLALGFAFFKSCRGSDADVDTTGAGSARTSLRVSAPALPR